MSQIKLGSGLCRFFLRPLLHSICLLPVLFFVSCEDDMPSSKKKDKDKDNGEAKITEVWVLQRVDISLVGEDGKRYAYSYTDRAHFDNEVEIDTYPYNYYDKVYSAYAYVLFDNNRIEALGYSYEYDEFKKNPGMLYPLSSKNVDYYRVEGNKLYIRVIYSWEYDLGEHLAFYIKSSDKSSIILEVYGDAIDGYFSTVIPIWAWSSAARDKVQYRYTAHYKRESIK